MVFRAPTQPESGEWLRESESAGILKPGAWDGVIHGCDEECVGKQKNSISYHCDSRKKCGGCGRNVCSRVGTDIVKGKITVS